MSIKIDEEFRALIRPQTEIERKHLEEAILADGCRDPLVLWDGVLIDGHNRLEICTKHGIEYDVEEMQFEGRDEAMNWIDKNQVGRRNLTRDEFSMIVGRVYAREKKAQGGRSDRDFSGDQNDHPKTAEKVGKEFGVSPATVKRAEKLFHKVEEVKQERKREPEPTETQAEAEEETLPLESPAPKPTPPQPRVKTGEEIRAEQDAIMEEAKRRVREEEAKKKEAKKQQRLAEIQSQREKIEAGVVEKPNGLYDVVCMDPPWNYGREYDPETSRVANPYPEMKQSELLEMEPPFADDCVLFLWTTHAFIWDAKELLQSWGFNYKATLVWDKERIGMGAWLRMQCEFCLVGIKGKPFWSNTTWRDIIREPRREHSRKPEVFYEMVESITAGRRLDFFSREQRKGWEAYGNDKTKF